VDTVAVYLYGHDIGFVFHKNKYEQLQHFFQTAEPTACLEIEGFYGHLFNFMRSDIQLVMYSSVLAKERNRLDGELTEKEERQYGEDD
jgi:hypothetical protein